MRNVEKFASVNLIMAALQQANFRKHDQSHEDGHSSSSSFTKGMGA